MKYRNVPLLKLNQIHFQVDGPTRSQSHQGAHNHMSAIPVRSKIKNTLTFPNILQIVRTV